MISCQKKCVTINNNIFISATEVMGIVNGNSSIQYYDKNGRREKQKEILLESD